MAKRNNKQRRKKKKQKKNEKRNSKQQLQEQEPSGVETSEVSLEENQLVKTSEVLVEEDQLVETSEVSEEQRQANLLNTIEHLMPLPLSYFERVVRSVLVPEENIETLKVWEQNDEFMEVIRNLYLSKRYRNTPEYIRATEAFSDPDALPSRSEIISIFGIRRPSVNNWTRPSPQQHLKRRNEILDMVVRVGALNGHGESSKNTECLSFEEILEAGGGCVYGRGAYNLFCEDSGRYEFWTQDYIKKLGEYLSSRLNDIGVESLRDGSILEIGCGNGALSYFLNKEESIGNIIIATDNDLRAAPRQIIQNNTSSYRVERSNYMDAVRKYQPSIVLCAWMPMDSDWTEDLRNFSCIQEIILIGEADFGNCGHNWLTWGNKDFIDHKAPQQKLNQNIIEKDILKKSSNAKEMIPPYVVDGWSRVDLNDLAKWQMQRYDNDLYSGNSTTVSFRRQRI